MSQLSKYLKDVANKSSMTTVSDEHFGVNFVSGTNSLAAGSNFRDVIAELGAGAIRYPGGTVTEKYFQPGTKVWRDLVEQKQLSTIAEDGAYIEGPSAVLNSAVELNLDVQFVLPTAGLVSKKNGKIVIDQGAVEDVVDLASDILAGKFGDVNVTHFEIGNEYYYFADLTPKEYSAVVDKLVPAINEAIEDAVASGKLDSEKDIPEIAVQAGAGWKELDNQKIIDGLSSDTLSYIDAVIFHYYPDNLEQVDQKGRNFSQIEDWKDATENSELNIFVSEWNVHGGSQPDLGMAQASSMISAFGALIEKGVDTASIWGAQFSFLPSGLTMNIGPEDLSEVETRLTPAGDVVASMRENLVGLNAITTPAKKIVDLAHTTSGKQADLNSDLETTLFGDEDRAVIYISSRSSEPLTLQLGIEAYFGEVFHAWGELMSVADDPISTWEDENDPTVFGGIPQYTYFTQDQIYGANQVVLKPFEILKVSIQLSDDGVTIEDDNPLMPWSFDYDDTLEGSDGDDRINARIGDDDVYGLGGDDSIRLGDGDDFASGGHGQDAIYGDSGSDVIYGEFGNDKIIGGTGSDRLYGGAGNDVLIGDQGSDLLFGGSGTDVLWTNNGRSGSVGGADADYFVVSAGSNLTIEDFSTSDGDKITFLGNFEKIEDLKKNTLITGRSDDYAGDIVVVADDGSRTHVKGVGDEFEAFMDAIVDFQPIGENSLELAEKINDMNDTEVRGWLDSLGTDEFESAFGSTDPIIVLANVKAKSAGILLDQLNLDDLTEVFGQEGAIGLLAGLSEYTVGEKVTTFDAISEQNAKEFSNFLGEQNIKSILDGLNPFDRMRLEPKFLGGGLEETDPDDTTSLEDIIPNREPDPDWEPQEEDDPKEVDADCFIATAVYHDGEHDHVWFLRWYRDNVMRKRALGRFLIALYWYVGPHAAEFIDGKPSVSRCIRLFISAIVVVLAGLSGREPVRQGDHKYFTASRRITLRNYKSVI